MNHDRNPQFVSHQMKRLEKRFDSLASTQGGERRRTVSKEAFCSQPEMSTNAFVGAYIDRLLEQLRLLGQDKERNATISTNGDEGSEDSSDCQHTSEETTRKKGGLTFTDFVHIFWVFSASASRGEKEEVVETLLDPDERGLVDRWKIFRFIKCVLPGVPDRAVNGVADDLMDTIQTGSKKRGAHIRKGSSARTSSDIGSSDVLIGEFMERGDFVDRLTLHI